MRKILGTVQALRSGGVKTKSSLCDEVAAGPGFDCATFDELQDCVARVSYFNPAWDIFLRGQTSDHQDINGRSSLVATIFRGLQAPADMSPREAALERHSLGLRSWARGSSGRGRPGCRGLLDYELARWSLLQHYGCYPTPLLDVTRSTRIAASFATQQPDKGGDRYVYVFGLPYPNGTITFNLGDELALVNLRNLMPPTARRPHWQEGYLVASFPKSTFLDPHHRKSDGSARLPAHNMARRLLTKLRIPEEALASFWNDDHSAVSEAKLAPSDDPILEELERLFA